MGGHIMPGHPGDRSRAIARWAWSAWLLAVVAGSASGQVCECQYAPDFGQEPEEGDRLGWNVDVCGIDVVAGAAYGGYANVYVDAGGLLYWWDTLLPPDGGGGFGSDVGIDGDTIIVGAQWDDDQGDQAGSAYIFERTDGTWTFAAKLTASDAEPWDWFGYAVAIDGDTAVVTGYGIAAYVFERDHGGPGAWGEVARLAPPRGYADTAHVDIGGDLIAAGRHIYERDPESGTWSWTAEIDFPEDGGWSVSVSIDGDTILYGSPYGGLFSEGRAYIYQRSAGRQDQWDLARTFSVDGVPYGYFYGSAVSIRGDLAVVGAQWGYDGCGGCTGAAYAYRRHQGGPDHWGLVATLAVPGDTTSNYFGRSVALEGGRAIFGTPGTWDCAGPCAGGVYAVDLDACAPTFTDLNGDGVSDVCQCLADLVVDQVVGVEDFLWLLSEWGCTSCPSDLDADGIVGVTDFLGLLALWGPCGP
jgi:hypothetical protein